jgi:hypothetical protein
VFGNKGIAMQSMAESSLPYSKVTDHNALESAIRHFAGNFFSHNFWIFCNEAADFVGTTLSPSVSEKIRRFRPVQWTQSIDSPTYCFKLSRIEDNVAKLFQVKVIVEV